MQHLPTNSLLQGGKYRIEKVLGQGGFGITYQATQVALNRKVAIKEFFMKEYCNRDEETSQVSIGSEGSKELVEKFRTKFIKEAQNIAGLSHPYIIRIHDIFEENGTAYYVMEYISHGSLSDLIKERGYLSEAEALHYIRQIADALGYIHERNMNHLDIKPSNILLDDKKNAVLIDFGLSKRYDAEGNQTSTTPVGISHGYAPLEQYKKGGVGTFSPATDIYSLGATLYKLVTGQTPPEANDIVNDGLPTQPTSVSPATVAAIEKAMQPSKKLRPANVAAFLALLTDEEEVTVIVEPTPQPNPITNPDPTPIPTSSLWKKWAVPLALCIVAALTVILWPKGEKDNKVETVVEQVIVPQKDSVGPIKTPTTTGTINGHEYVDLGLSVKWADCNVGANSPSDYGSYFAWGETSTKSEYTKSNSVTNEKDFGDIRGNSQYDAARANWGGSWRLPTKDEFQELVDKCKWVWTTQGGHNGYKVTGPNGNSIFLPAAGLRFGASLLDAGEDGYYWSSAPNGSITQYAYYLKFSSGVHYVNWIDRNLGLSVRPVSDKLLSDSEIKDTQRLNADTKTNVLKSQIQLLNATELSV